MQVPSHYLVSNKLSDDQAESVRRALSLTPVDCAVVQTSQDVEYAQKFSEMIVHSEAIPSLIAGGARFVLIGNYPVPLAAVYKDWQEIVPC